MVDAVVFYSVAVITVFSGAWGLALTLRARRLSQPMPFSLPDLGAIAVSTVVALMFVIAFAIEGGR